MAVDISKKFGERIALLRSERGWSQEELADRTGLHRTYISGVERGVRNPTLTVINRLAGAFSVPLSELLDMGD
jgi:transcriptional regulator with XRE-family HTH domain